MNKTLTITRPDDWHLHLRDNEELSFVARHTACRFGRAIIMPNLLPPITSLEQAIAYRQRILAACMPIDNFQPLMTLYATDNMRHSELEKAVAANVVKALKVYPAGATTNSDSGVTELGKLDKVLAAMQEMELPLLLHGEVTDPKIDVFDREAIYIETILKPLIDKYPRLRIVLEHISSAQAAEFIKTAPDNIAATITPQHLLLNRNAIFEGGLRPHNYCLPVLKRQRHQLALQQLVKTGSAKVFLGTDSAPHSKNNKQSCCGCAGIYSAAAAIELYAHVFDKIGALEHLEAFASLNGARFYRLPINRDKISLQKISWQIPASYPYAKGQTLVPLMAGESLNWKITAGLKNGGQ